MMPLDEALGKIVGSARPMGTERVPLDKALNRFLAEDVRSDVDMPPFNRSAMDGYACRREDLGRDLTVVETIHAGAVPRCRVGPGQCAKIMTGAIVPEGADCVFVVERTEPVGPGMVRFAGDRTESNICPQGEDVRSGDVVLRKGLKIRPQHIAMLASAGCAQPPVACRPRVGVIATGGELVSPAETPGPGQIRDSNGYQIAAQIVEAGAVPHSYGVVGDTEEAIENAFVRAAAENDVVLFSGGISMGERDLVPDILLRNGVEIRVRKIAIQPGLPTLFGLSRDVACFGLPGNPVATLVIFELLVRPFLAAMMGGHGRPQILPAPLIETVRRKKTDRESWIPVKILEGGGAAPLPYHGSAHTAALCEADGLIALAVGVAEIPKGTIVHVRCL